jgi:hypothetical protein
MKEASIMIGGKDLAKYQDPTTPELKPAPLPPGGVVIDCSVEGNPKGMVTLRPGEIIVNSEGIKKINELVLDMSNGHAQLEDAVEMTFQIDIDLSSFPEKAKKYFGKQKREKNKKHECQECGPKGIHGIGKPGYICYGDCHTCVDCGHKEPCPECDGLCGKDSQENSKPPAPWEGLKYAFPWKQEESPFTVSHKKDVEAILLLSQAGYYDLLEYKTPDQKTALLFRLGRVSEDEWNFQILEQDERFRGEEESVNYPDHKYKKIYVESVNALLITTRGIYLRGSDKEQDNKIDDFSATTDELKDILLALLDWAKNWKGWKK